MQSIVNFILLSFETVWLIFMSSTMLGVKHIPIIQMSTFIPAMIASLIVQHFVTNMFVRVVCAILIYTMVVWLQNYTHNPFKVLVISIITFAMMVCIEFFVSKVVYDVLKIHIFQLKDKIMLHVLLNIPIKTIMYIILYINYFKMRRNL